MIEIEDGGKKRKPAPEALRLERMVAQQKKQGGEGEQGKHSVAEHRQGGVELDPVVAAEDVRARRVASQAGMASETRVSVAARQEVK